MVREAHLLRTVRGHRSGLDDLPNLLRRVLVLRWIPRTFGAVESLVYDIADPRLLEKATESVSRNREPGRYADPFRGQLSEIGAFSPDQLNIVPSHLV